MGTITSKILLLFIIIHFTFIPSKAQGKYIVALYAAVLV